MNFFTAIDVVKSYGAAMGIDDFIEIMNYMAIQKDCDNLSIVNEEALQVVIDHTCEILNKELS